MSGILAVIATVFLIITVVLLFIAL